MREENNSIFWEKVFFNHEDCHWFIKENVWGDKNICAQKKSWKLKRYMSFLPQRKLKECKGTCFLFVPKQLWDYSRNPNEILKEMKEEAKKWKKKSLGNLLKKLFKELSRKD